MRQKTIKEKKHFAGTGKKISYFKIFKNDEKAIELPINIVVMLVVGMVALAALLSIIPKSKENLSVDIIDIKIDNGTLQEGSVATVSGAGEYKVRVFARVYDKNNNPVEKASVTINGGGGFGVDQTNGVGEAIVYLGETISTKVTLRPNQKSVALKLVAKANGYYDYEDENAVTLYQK
ncbi:MAG: carboxypeptidase regulatory-like domain-containing protein [Candidatus Methanoperedens sp.]|nr:carboxypeptidase regulatory-like domain-containing protein [Candidatus Methanoperedens sp.]